MDTDYRSYENTEGENAIEKQETGTFFRKFLAVMLDFSFAFSQYFITKIFNMLGLYSAEKNFVKGWKYCSAIVLQVGIKIDLNVECYWRNR